MKLPTAIIITWTALSTAAADATADGQQPRDLDLQESRYKVKAKPEPYKPPQPAPNFDDFHPHAQVLFPARTTPFTTTTSRSNVEDLKSLRRGKEAVPAKSKEVSKKKYRRLRKVKKRRRRKKDRTTTPKPATTRRPILPLFDLEEDDDDDDQKAFKKERAASRLEPSRTTPFRYYTPTKKPTTRYPPSPTPFGPHLPPDRRKKQGYKPPKPKYSRPTTTTKAPYVPAVYEPEPYEEEPVYEPVKLLYKEHTPKPAYIPKKSYSPKPSYRPKPAYTPKPAYSLKPSYTPKYTPKPSYTPKPYKPKPEKPQAYYPSKPKPKLAPRLPTPRPAYVPSPEPSYHSTAYTPSPSPAYSPSPSPKASRYRTPIPEYSLAPEPEYEPSPQPAYRSTPSPGPLYHSTPKPSYRSTTPLYEPAALHSSLEPTYHSTPKPAYRSTPEPSPPYKPPLRVNPAYHHPPPPPPEPSPKPSYPTTPVFIPHEPPSIVSHPPGLADEYLLDDYDDYEKKPYSFTYGVRDARSGADFEQNEERSGHVTRGSYKVALPDGRTQIVTYTADDVHGFKAEVTYEGEASYPKPGEYEYRGPGLRPNFGPGAAAPLHERHQPPVELVDFPPVLSHPTPLRPPHGESFRLPDHFNLDHFGLSAADVAESVRDEVEIRHSGYLIPKVVPPPTASPVRFTTAASPTTPYYTTVTPYDRPERHRPPNRPPSPPSYRPVRHKRQKSKETEFELGEEVDYSDDDIKEVREEDGTSGVQRLPKFANFEPSPDDSKPDGTKALAGKNTRSSQSQETTSSSKRKKKYFGPYSPSAPRRSKKSKTPSSSIESPPPKFTNFVGPYAESAYIRPTTYRPSKEFIQKLKSKRNAAKSKNK